MSGYDALAPYWVVYQYGTKCPHIFSTYDRREYDAFVNGVPATIIKTSDHIDE